MLPKEFEWEIIEAKKKYKKGRASGGFLIGVRKEWLKKRLVNTKEVEEGLVKTEIGKDGETVKIWSVYNAKNTARILEKLDEIGIEEKDKIIIGGDFNIRTGEKGRYIDTANKEEYVHGKSKNKKCSNNWEKLIDLCEGKG